MPTASTTSSVIRCTPASSFDWRRLMSCLVLVPSVEEPGFRLGVTEGGLHAAESLVLARYLMFTQVYFNKTRVAFDHHLHHALAEVLPGGVFPPPSADALDEFLGWDDWRVLGALAEGRGGEHGRRLRQRDHFREVYHTPETPSARDLARFRGICDNLGPLLRTVVSAEKSWYKVDKLEIPVRSDNPGRRVVSLSKLSTVVAGLKPIDKRMAYCAPEDKERALAIVVKREGRSR
ncbi:MAG TPA: hypothetical protein PK867_28775 [Pirellulales bacterium]|nr:hypothetical protein [Pirellulales bacterium]